METKDYFAVDTNIRLGVAYLSYLSKKFDGDMVFCAYNAGEGVVKKWIENGGEIKYKETREYVEKIKNMIKRIKNKVSMLKILLKKAKVKSLLLMMYIVRIC